MKVKELINKLKEFDPDSVVFVQAYDANGYGGVSEVNGYHVFVEDEGFVVDTRWTAQKARMSEDDFEKLKLEKRCAIIVAFD